MPKSGAFGSALRVPGSFLTLFLASAYLLKKSENNGLEADKP